MPGVGSQQDPPYHHQHYPHYPYSHHYNRHYHHYHQARTQATASPSSLAGESTRATQSNLLTSVFQHLLAPLSERCSSREVVQ